MPVKTKIKKVLTFLKRKRITLKTSHWTEFDIVNGDGQFVGYLRLRHEIAFKELVKGRKGPLPDHFIPDEFVLQRGFDVIRKPKYRTIPGQAFEPYTNRAIQASIEARQNKKAELKPEVEKEETTESEGGIQRNKIPLQRGKSPIEQMREAYPEMDDEDLQEMLNGENLDE